MIRRRPADGLCRILVQLAVLLAVGAGIVRAGEEESGQDRLGLTLSVEIADEVVMSETAVVDQVQFSSDGEYLMVEQDGLVTLWSLETGQVEIQFQRGDPTGRDWWDDGRPLAPTRVTFENGVLAYYASADDGILLRSWSKKRGFETVYHHRSSDGRVYFSDIAQSGDGSRIAWMVTRRGLLLERVMQLTERGWAPVRRGFWQSEPVLELEALEVDASGTVRLHEVVQYAVPVLAPPEVDVFGTVRLDAGGSRVLRHLASCPRSGNWSGVMELADVDTSEILWRRSGDDYRVLKGFGADGSRVAALNFGLLADQCGSSSWADDFEVTPEGVTASTVVVDTANGDSFFRVGPTEATVDIVACTSDEGVEGFLRVDLLERGDGYGSRDKYGLERFSSVDGATLDSGHLLEEYEPDLNLECDRTGDWWLLGWDPPLGDSLRALWDLQTGDSVALPGPKVDNPSGHHFAFSADGTLLATVDGDGVVSLWRLSREPIEAQQLARLASFEGGSWAVLTPAGLYDASDPADFDLLSWQLPGDNGSALPLSVFYREFYEPRLLARLLDGELLAPPSASGDLDRTQPLVHIVDIRPAADDRAHVLVAARQSDEEGVRDLKLFRDGQLVASHSLDTAAEAVANDNAWIFRGGDVVEIGDWPDDRAGRGQEQSWLVSFPDIELPASASGEIEFAAYVFNRDGIKSKTHRLTHPRPEAGESGRTAFVIVVGVNAHENAAWDLKYAADDAKATREIVVGHLESSGAFEKVVPVSLVAERGDSGTIMGTAERADLVAVLDVLAGGHGNPDRLALIPGADLLGPARPDDLVYLAFSGHGLSGEKGAFHFFFSDIGEGRVRKVDSELLGRTLGSDVLASYVSRIDAGKFVLVVDACNSAASVQGGGFKPGPMGSRGLGQLAYDKAMLVVAASQVEDVALESDRLRHGLLSYALLREGLEGGAADTGPKDGLVGFGELLSYAVERVPALYGELASGRFVQQGRGLETFRPSGTKTEAASAQRPVVFDFRRGEWELRMPVAAPRASEAEQPSTTGPSKVVGEIFRDPLRTSGVMGPEMVVIPPGSFQMGCVSGVECNNDELPVHEVRIGKPLAVAKYEVTFEDWEACQRATGCSDWAGQSSAEARDPVVNVSWEDAQDYVRWLSRETGATYRLLSESEWEYAARAGTITAYSWGNEHGSWNAESRGMARREGANWRLITKTAWDDHVANTDSYGWAGVPFEQFRSGDLDTVDPSYDFIRLWSPVAQVGSFAPNDWGFHDMHGNVEEWTQDCWNESYNGAPSEGRAWLSEDCSERVVRGGSAGSWPTGQRAASRGSGAPDGRHGERGLRVARPLRIESLK